MKKIIFVLALLVLVVAASGCTGDIWASNKTFSGNGVTFVYPGSWSNEDPNQYGTVENFTNVASVGDMNYGFALSTTNVPSSIQANSGTFLNLLKNSISKYPNATLETQKDINVDGVQGIQVNYSNVQGLNSNESFLSAVAWIKNNKAYLVVYGAKNNDTQTLDRILSTVQTS